MLVHWLSGAELTGSLFPTLCCQPQAPNFFLRVRQFQEKTGSFSTKTNASVLEPEGPHALARRLPAVLHLDFFRLKRLS